MAKLRNLLQKNGKIFLHPSIEKISFKSLEFFSARLLKLNSLVHDWKYEKGDHAISSYRGDGELMYFYHYPNESQFRQEVADAGYKEERLACDWFILTLAQ